MMKERREVGIGTTFLVKFWRKPLAMEIIQIQDNIAMCRSLDLLWTGRFRVDSIKKALAEGRA